jgi:hypothetical protein
MSEDMKVMVFLASAACIMFALGFIVGVSAMIRIDKETDDED